jgi:hypothetical protein
VSRDEVEVWLLGDEGRAKSLELIKNQVLEGVHDE